MDRDEEIRLIAYHIWEEEGCVHGRDCEHWAMAVQIWESQQPQPAVTTKKRAPARSRKKPTAGTARKTGTKKNK